MTPAEFARLLERDGGACVHCGATEGLVPQHRINRGMGGSEALERPSNVVLFCSWFNGAIEDSAELAQLAQMHGWKLSRWDSGRLREIPVYDRNVKEWFWLDNDYNRTLVE